MSWRDEAACKPYPLDVFFPAPGEHHLAVKVCRGCPVRRECLEDALATEDRYDPHGVRGGLTARERRVGAGLGPDCGTLTGWHAHRHRGERPCPGCREAMAAYHREWRQKRRMEAS